MAAEQKRYSIEPGMERTAFGRGRYQALAAQTLGEPVQRRELTLGLLALGIAIAAHADAQTAAPGLPRVVTISTGDEALFRPSRDRFLQGIRELGHAEGRTFG